MSLDLRAVTKRFGAHDVLQGIDLRVARGTLTALLGPSGSGKTTLLRIIAGLEQPDSGTVSLLGVDATGMPVQRRRVGYVFQHYALFRTMTVFENVAFGLRVRPRRERPASAEIRRRVDALLDRVQLTSFATRYPAQLSGGQRQRVAFARALAIEPAILLLDEPFGALDASLRSDLRQWLRAQHDELHLTTVLVTHDEHDARALADDVVIMRDGRIVPNSILRIDPCANAEAAS